MRWRFARLIGIGKVLPLFGMIVSAHAGTPLVAAGCPIPDNKPAPHTYYVDPVHGSMAGDGSAAKPWHTLQEVFDVRYRLVANAPATYVAGIGIIQPNPSAPINSGDTIYLLTGSHGSVLIQGNFGTNTTLAGYNNDDFITIAAAPGQTPVITQLILKGANKYQFKGLTFQSLQNVASNNGQPFSSQSGTADYFLINLIGPNSNIIINKNHILSQADTSQWSQYDWLSKRASGFTASGGNCLSVSNNLIENIGFAIGAQRANHVLISRNTINKFTDDGIDFGSDNTVIDGNLIINNIEDNDGFHRDGMQGQPFDINTPVLNTTITNNLIINQTQPLVAPGYLQGIDTFDGMWNNVSVANNIVVTNAYHGITFYGTTGISIINNTVIGVATGINGVSTWIDISPSKSGNPSSNVTVRNNVASLFGVSGVNVIQDHNIVATYNTNYIKYFKASGAISNAVTPDKLFNVFNAASFAYDMRLRTGGAAVNGGTPTSAPATDIRGYLRGRQIDLGAVKFGGTPIVSLQ